MARTKQSATMRDPAFITPPARRTLFGSDIDRFTDALPSESAADGPSPVEDPPAKKLTFVAPNPVVGDDRLRATKFPGQFDPEQFDLVPPCHPLPRLLSTKPTTDKPIIEMTLDTESYQHVLELEQELDDEVEIDCSKFTSVGQLRARMSTALVGQKKKEVALNNVIIKLQCRLSKLRARHQRYRMARSVINEIIAPAPKRIRHDSTESE